MKLIHFFVAALLLVSSPVVLADKPDPELPNPPVQVWIAGGEVIDADVSGSTVDANIVNTPERIPWSTSMNAQTDGNDYYNFWLMTYPGDYPEGSILVIESFSYIADLPPGEKVSVSLLTQGGGELGVFRLSMPQTTGISFGSKDVYQDNVSIRAYAGGEEYVGSSVNVHFDMTSTSTYYDLEINLSGYFVPEDSPSLAP